MSAVPLSQKLVMLYLLDRCGHPLTNEQIDRYMQQNHWSDYMLLQQLKAELREAEMVAVSDGDPTFYMLLPKGRDSLHLFENRIPLVVHRQLDLFLEHNAAQIEKDSMIFTRVIPEKNGDYLAELRTFAGQNLAFCVSVTLPNRERAKETAEKMAEENEALYAMIAAFLDAEQ